jgi:hypothetical protein
VPVGVLEVCHAKMVNVKVIATFVNEHSFGSNN